LTFITATIAASK
jgi:hypothetical protein